MAQSGMRDPGETERGHGLVLVVDDDKMMRLLARQSLERAGFVVVEAADGTDALTAFDEHLPDVVLLDVQMPGMDGFETCRTLRESTTGRFTPVMMMTGLDDVESIEQAYEAGATDFINKPLNWLVLGHRLEYILRSSRSAERLRLSQAKLANAQRIAKLGYWEWVPGKDRLFSSGELRRIFGMPEGHRPSSLQELALFVHEDQRQQFLSAVDELLEGTPIVDFEYRIRTADGAERFVRQHAEALLGESGHLTRVTGTIQDVTEQREAEEKARYMAYYDGITGLPNRRSFTETLERFLEDPRFRTDATAVLFVDLDRLNQVNESLGRSAGDELVRQAALRIVKCVRSTDLVARAARDHHQHLVSRFDGDEFVILLTHLADIDATAMIAQRLGEALAEPFAVAGQEIFVTANIGIGIFSHDGDTAEQLLRNAHLAAEHAKETEGRSCQFYTESLNEAARERLTLEADLRRALDRGELELNYQPQFRVADNSIVGAEALLRWHHSELGTISPAVFIPLAEEIGLIHEVGEWVLETACRQARRWQEQYDGRFRIAANISNRQFLGSGLLPTVRRVLSGTGLDPRFLELELTESVILGADDNELSQLAELRALGLKLAIDDFGTGYSSLSYLTRFPVDALKIDRSFIRDVPGLPQKEAIAKAIIAMGQSLGLRVIAEGVETAAQLHFLRGLDCDEQQGFLMAEPMTAADLSQRLAEGLSAGHRSAAG